MKKTYIILLNYNGWQDTIECLESVLRSDFQNYQVIVVDNDSPNDSMTRIIDWAEGRQEVIYSTNTLLKEYSQPFVPKPIEYVLYERAEAMIGGYPELESEKNNPLIFIKSGENKGFSAGNNIGIAYALAKDDADNIWLLNNDTVIEKDSLSRLVEKIKYYKDRNQRVGILGAKLMYYHTPAIIQGVGGSYNKWFASSGHIGAFEEDRGQYDSEEIVKKIKYPLGASIFVSTAFIKDVGLMCEDYFLYFEELDWMLRGKAHGWELGYCWQAKVFHKEGGSIGSSANAYKKSELSDFYGLRNRIVFSKKFFPEILWSVRLGFLVVLLNRVRRGQFSRLRLVFRALLKNNLQ